MKKILVVLLVLLGLQTQAQTLCDIGVYTTGSQFQMEVVIGQTGNSLPMMSPIYVVTYGGSSMPWNIGNQPMLAEDSCFGGPCTHMVFNYNPAGNPYDTLMTCIFYELTDSVGNIDTLMCCDDWVWDGSSVWFKLGTQQPYFCCDSITYWIDQSQGFNIGLDTSGMVHNPDSMTIYWGICTGFSGGGICYTGSGMYDYFPQITTADTVKVGYDVYIYENGSVEVCSVEEWLIFNGTSWVLFNMTTSINEITFNKINDNKIYDLLGRELTNIPVGKLYIRNQKLYITR